MTDLEVFELGTDPFTNAETLAVFDFESAVHNSGLSDCFDCFTVETVRDHESEFGQESTREMLAIYAGMLNDWYLAIDRLMADILTCTSEVTRYSTAAARYIHSAAEAYHRTRQDFEHTTTTWYLALLAGGPDADYPPPTRGVNLFMQELTSEP